MENLRFPVDSNWDYGGSIANTPFLGVEARNELEDGVCGEEELEGNLIGFFIIFFCCSFFIQFS